MDPAGTAAKCAGSISAVRNTRENAIYHSKEYTRCLSCHHLSYVTSCSDGIPSTALLSSANSMPHARTNVLKTASRQFLIASLCACEIGSSPNAEGNIPYRAYIKWLERRVHETCTEWSLGVVEKFRRSASSGVCLIAIRRSPDLLLNRREGQDPLCPRASTLRTILGASTCVLDISAESRISTCEQLHSHSRRITPPTWNHPHLHNSPSCPDCARLLPGHVFSSRRLREPRKLPGRIEYGLATRIVRLVCREWYSTYCC